MLNRWNKTSFLEGLGCITHLWVVNISVMQL